MLSKKNVTVWAVCFALVLVVAALAAVGCGSGDADKPAGLALTDVDNGKSFTVKVGDTITVVIPGNPTTGYEWATDLSEDSAALLALTGDPVYQQDPGSEDLVGAGGEYTFTFTAKAAGQAELGLKYWRSFEAEVDPIDTFAVNVTIE